MITPPDIPDDWQTDAEKELPWEAWAALALLAGCFVAALGVGLFTDQ